MDSDDTMQPQCHYTKIKGSNTADTTVPLKGNVALARNFSSSKMTTQ